MALSLPVYSANRHPIEAWQEWYSSNQAAISLQIQRQESSYGKLFSQFLLKDTQGLCGLRKQFSLASFYWCKNCASPKTPGTLFSQGPRYMTKLIKPSTNASGVLTSGSHIPGSDVRLLCPYEYTNSLNQRQVWEPYLTGYERQEFDSQLRVSVLHKELNRDDGLVSALKMFPSWEMSHRNKQLHKRH
jgi:hypothetical protein